MRSDRERLLDIIEAAEKIAARVQRGRAAFDVDEDVRFAVVHLLEIVGEAAGGVSEELRSRGALVAHHRDAQPDRPQLLRRRP